MPGPTVADWACMVMRIVEVAAFLSVDQPDDFSGTEA